MHKVFRGYLFLIFYEKRCQWKRVNSKEKVMTGTSIYPCVLFQPPSNFNFLERFEVLILKKKKKKRSWREWEYACGRYSPWNVARDFSFVKPYPILRTLSFCKDILKVFSNMQTFSGCYGWYSHVVFNVIYFLPMGVMFCLM